MSNTTLKIGFLSNTVEEPSATSALPELPELPELPDKNSFGIAKLSIPEMESRFDIVHWVLTIDKSGSMSDRCKDGKTKISHIRETISYIMDFLLNCSIETEQEHYVSLIGFSHTVNTVCLGRLVDSKFVCELPQILAGFKPGGSTSFEVALPETNSALKLEFSPDKTIQRVNIFMTDGNITHGTTDLKYLKSIYACKNANHVFVGFGKDNDSTTLEELANVYRGSYYFIESIENAGLVYGEIIHECLHEVYCDIEVKGDNLEIYDFNKNLWVNKLKIDNLASGKERVWQIRAIEPYNPYAEDGDIRISLTYRLAGLLQPPTPAPIQSEFFKSDDINGRRDEIKKYWWRQCTQELVGKVRELLAKKRKNDCGGALSDRSCRLKRNVTTQIPLSHNSESYKKTVEEGNIILDAAKKGRWNIVDLILNEEPQLINIRPNPRRFNLIHHAIYQNNICQVENLINRGADTSIATRDGIDCKSLASSCGDNNIQILLSKINNFDYNKESSELQDELNIFLGELKKYISSNIDLMNDVFMQSLCDDIYVSVLALSSKLGELFVGARHASLGNERAYNMQDIDDLHLTSNRRGHVQVPLMSRSATTSYATAGAVRIMRSCSGRVIDKDNEIQRT